MRKAGKKFKYGRDSNAFMRALNSSKPLDQGQKFDLGIAYRTAYQVLRTPHGREEHFHTVACSLNIAMILAERGYGAEYLQKIINAQQGLMRCLERGKRTAKWGLDGNAIASINEALAVHDEQIEIVTHGELKQVLVDIHKRVVAGHTFQEMQGSLALA